jgi:iron-sulfur cluster assembly protein
MRDFLGKHPAAQGVRFGIKRTGCSGFGYTVDLASEVTGDDRVFDLDGIRLVVDAKALPFVDGTRIDYAREGLNAAFVFHNPNATGECGCGESFTVEGRGIGAG